MQWLQNYSLFNGCWNKQMKISQRATYLLGFIIICALLAASAWFQEVKHVMPCLLCVVQRLCFLGIGIFFLLGILLANVRRLKIFLPILIIILSSIGAYFSGRQVWLQYTALPNNQDICGVSLDYLFRILPWRDAMITVLNGNHECAERSISILGLDIAAWSLMSFILFFVMGLWLIKQVKKNSGINIDEK